MTEQALNNLGDICQAYWLLQGVPSNAVRYMRTQMTREIEAQLRMGKQLDEIIGTDPIAFGDHWAREYLYLQAIARMPSLCWRKRCYTSIFLVGWLFAALLEHLLWFSLTIPFSWVQLGIPILLVGIAHLTLFPELAQPAKSLPWREQTRLLAISVLFALVVLPACLVFLPFEGWGMIVPWSWSMTIMLALCAILSVHRLLREPYATWLHP